MPLDFGGMMMGGGGGSPAASGGGGGWNISAPLNFSGAGAGAFNSKNPGAAYASAYNAALTANQANYNNIIGGYRQTMAAQQQAQSGVRSGYSALQGSVAGLLAGTDAAERQRLNDQYAQTVGASNQSLINRGLGNTTVQSATTRGLTLDKAKADVELANRFAQLQAGYQSQIGLAGLGYDERAIGQNSALANQQLQFMNSVSIPYPDAGVYMQMAAMNNRNRQGGAGGGFPTVGGSVGAAGSGIPRSPFQNLGGGGGGGYNVSFNGGGTGGGSGRFYDYSNSPASLDVYSQTAEPPVNDWYYAENMQDNSGGYGKTDGYAMGPEEVPYGEGYEGQDELFWG